MQCSPLSGSVTTKPSYLTARDANSTASRTYRSTSSLSGRVSAFSSGSKPLRFRRRNNKRTGATIRSSKGVVNTLTTPPKKAGGADEEGTPEGGVEVEVVLDSGITNTLDEILRFPHSLDQTAQQPRRTVKVTCSSVDLKRSEVPRLRTKWPTLFPLSPALSLSSSSITIPRKGKRRGEDAHFVADNVNTLGVADGVSEWAEEGVDAGQYARDLMYHCKLGTGGIEEKELSTFAHRLGDPLPWLRNQVWDWIRSGEHLMQVLSKAHDRVKVDGSCTACIVRVRNSHLEAINLGDSGFLVVRNGEIVLRSSPQQHSFNCPYQLASRAGGDEPKHARLYSCPVQPGDMLLVATDGVFDNIRAEELASILQWNKHNLGEARDAARKIANRAHNYSTCFLHKSPFAQAANDAAHQHQGGKADDITVIVSHVH
mmetsp:Transcript_25662/g.31122  ORF Transcript_25662/g.31122 Transcript_25662/m.31122 type:complete len:428 (+) Transcript_25662:452-1735(+)|eukprot:CAMPEP_0197846068 /NCGR_PEP_ID=MMETSP1438-20131217/2889_1 /TAXON_ID=1461541 /ORGANISM="Pterosperma sp., Strain CCMP1384" /LENGTH=427 /DNA_ID=CAMNT_0043457587 /DNA_START=452 /DNA_END=1735 /DNA_ORIENTATION=-